MDEEMISRESKLAYGHRSCAQRTPWYQVSGLPVQVHSGLHPGRMEEQEQEKSWEGFTLSAPLLCCPFSCPQRMPSLHTEADEVEAETWWEGRGPRDTTVHFAI